MGDGLLVGGTGVETIDLGSVAPGETVALTRSVTGVSIGSHVVTATLECAELGFAHGAEPIDVPNECLRGNVDIVLGVAQDVLFVNGGVGAEPDRRVVVNRDDPFELFFDAPISKPDGPSTLPYGIGRTCLPTPLDAGATPQPKRIANNIGKTRLLGVENWPGPPTSAAPATILDLPTGLGKAGRFFFQGLILSDGAPNGRIAVTNGVLVESS